MSRLRSDTPALEEISAAFGAPFPDPLRRVLAALFAANRRSPTALRQATESLGFQLDGDWLDAFEEPHPTRPRRQALAPGCPPEYFTFASTGVDGATYGCLIHAPELPAADHPCAAWCPMDGDPIGAIGATTAEAWEWLLSSELWFLEQEERDAAAALDLQRTPSWRLIVEALSIAPTPSVQRRVYSDERLLPVQPTIPSGWRHVLTEDGVGVLAPADLFSADQPPAGEAPAPPEAVDRAESALSEAKPATALWWLRRAWWVHWSDKKARTALSPLMARAYEVLGRPTLADRIVRAAGS